jgi:hypothetical protein
MDLSPGTSNRKRCPRATLAVSWGEPSFAENLQLYHPEDRDFFLARVPEANQGIPQNFDAGIVRPTGEIRYINARIEID